MFTSSVMYMCPLIQISGVNLGSGNERKYRKVILDERKMRISSIKLNLPKYRSRFSRNRNVKNSHNVMEENMIIWNTKYRVCFVVGFSLLTKLQRYMLTIQENRCDDPINRLRIFMHLWEIYGKCVKIHRMQIICKNI